jgi:hypothetical protein
LEVRKCLVVLLAALGAVFCPTSIASTYVSGNITTNTTWDLAGSPYILVDSVTVNSGVSLTIQSGVEVTNGVIYVSGRLNATGATCNAAILYFSESSGTLSDCQLNWISIYDGTPTITGNAFSNFIQISGGTPSVTGNTVPYLIFSGGTPTVTGNTVTNAYPIYISDPDILSQMSGVSGNTYTAADPTIWIWGAVDGTVALGALDGLTRYRVDSYLTVSNGASLSIRSGIEVTGAYIYVYGRLNATGATVSAPVYYYSGSSGTMTGCKVGQLCLYSDTSLHITGNDLSGA